MIKGCSNHNCAVKRKTEGQFTCSICNCVKTSWARDEGDPRLIICGVPVGPTFGVQAWHDAIAIKNWLRDGGLHDILKLAETKDETDKKGE